MLTYNMDVTPESVWKRTTPSEAELAQPYYCTEAGLFYAQQRFSTARTDKARMLEIGAQAAIAARGIAEKYYGTKA